MSTGPTNCDESFDSPEECTGGSAILLTASLYNFPQLRQVGLSRLRHIGHNVSEARLHDRESVTKSERTP